jgi:hypothetical protein
MGPDKPCGTASQDSGNSRSIMNSIITSINGHGAPRRERETGLRRIVTPEEYAGGSQGNREAR